MVCPAIPVKWSARLWSLILLRVSFQHKVKSILLSSISFTRSKFPCVVFKCDENILNLGNKDIIYNELLKSRVDVIKLVFYDRTVFYSRFSIKLQEDSKRPIQYSTDRIIMQT